MIVHSAVQSSTWLLFTMLFCSQTPQRSFLQQSPFSNWETILAVIARLLAKIERILHQLESLTLALSMEKYCMLTFSDIKILIYELGIIVKSLKMPIFS